MALGAYRCRGSLGTYISYRAQGAYRCRGSLGTYKSYTAHGTNRYIAACQHQPVSNTTVAWHCLGTLHRQQPYTATYCCSGRQPVASFGKSIRRRQSPCSSKFSRGTRSHIELFLTAKNYKYQVRLIILHR